MCLDRLMIGHFDSHRAGTKVSHDRFVIADVVGTASIDNPVVSVKRSLTNTGIGCQSMVVFVDRTM